MLTATTKYSDEELVTAIRSGKNVNEAILYLYQQYSGSTSSFIASKGGSMQDGEDMFQETVVAFINIVKAGNFRKEATIKTFLNSIAKNIWFNEIRKRQSTGNRERIFEDNREIIEDDISHHIADLEKKQHFRSLLNKMGEDCRKLLLLFYYEELSMKELVEHLPYENEQVVRNKKYKCLKQLTTIVHANPLIKSGLK
ncbi:MAG: sigma-70 family RNA polymerase sigma factor [Chitinophagaceae bacterium]|nr:MAG: sigma-70 family RNA polymerase sigma factor [Chitinophagaceae bacterium]